MHSLNLTQRGKTYVEKSQQQNNSNGNGGSWIYDIHSDQTYFTSNFDLTCRTIGGSLEEQHALRRDPYKRNKRLFTAWVVKLNNDNQLVVEGLLECGRRARTKPITERLGSSKILSESKHFYYLVGNMADSQYELPGFVRHRFHAGFPEDWEMIVEIWKSFITWGSEAGIRLSSMPDDLVVEKKLKLAIGGCLDSNCFMECAQKVNRVDFNSEKQQQSPDRSSTKEYNKSFQEGRIINSGNGKTGEFIRDYEPQDDKKSTSCNRMINNIKRITGWTPLVVSDENLKHCLLFRGTLLSSMGHAVNKNYMTEAVHRRLSPRIIETINNEFYELLGDVNIAKRDIPKELITWCRYGCPKKIDLFCEKWKILKCDEVKFGTGKSEEELKIGQAEQSSLEMCHKNSGNLSPNGRINPLPIIQPERQKNKRKRIPIELNDDHSASDSSIQDNDKDKNSKKAPQVQLTVSHQEDKRRPSPLKNKIVPLLSYVYHRCAPLTDVDLSDGV